MLFGGKNLKMSTVTSKIASGYRLIVSDTTENRQEEVATLKIDVSLRGVARNLK